MRIVVVGTSGAGKTTLARRLSAEFGLPFIELDTINWQPGWRSLEREDFPEFQRRVADATAGERWISDGNYGSVRRFLWSRATHLVWLDYGRAVIMRRVIGRSLARALDRKELWAGNREDWRTWLHASHPIRWAWDTWKRRRTTFEDMLASPHFAHLTVFRLARPRDVAGLAPKLREG